MNVTINATSAVNAARSVTATTAHGAFTTPCFMPVGTYAAVNCMTPRALTEAGSQIILGGNTYHMLVAPGMDFIERAGGMHEMMAWHGPMLTDSGGYQVFSLSDNSSVCKIKEDGAHFKHPVNGKIIKLTPKTSIEAQKIIGADIIMAFDQCTPEAGGRDVAQKAMERTHRWLLESIDTYTATATTPYGHPQHLFGIIQGGRFRDLREQSMAFLLEQPLDGLAIGGESIGHDMPLTDEILEWLVPHLPANKLRYTMGVGLHPQDLIDVVAKGIDIFDCVAPTRNARHGSLYHGQTLPDGKGWVSFNSTEDRGRILIKKACYAHDNGPILKGCDCSTCAQFSRAYLHYLFKARHPLFAPLACAHNIRVMQRTCEVMRATMENS